MTVRVLYIVHEAEGVSARRGPGVETRRGAWKPMERRKKECRRPRRVEGQPPVRFACDDGGSVWAHVMQWYMTSSKIHMLSNNARVNVAIETISKRHRKAHRFSGKNVLVLSGRPLLGRDDEVM